MSVSNRKKDDRKSRNGHRARVKLRWMELDVEGGTADLAEGFRSFAAALTLSTPVKAPARTLGATNPAANTSTAIPETPITEDQSPAEPAERGAEEELP